MDETALSTGTAETPAPEQLATTTDVHEATVTAVTIGAEADKEITEAVDELSQADAALATWLGDIDERSERTENEVKGLREWATQFQASVSAALEGHGNILGQIQEHLLTAKSETPLEKKGPSPSETETEKEPPKEAEKPEEQKVPLMDENAGARKKKIGWI